MEEIFLKNLKQASATLKRAIDGLNGYAQENTGGKYLSEPIAEALKLTKKAGHLRGSLNKYT